MNRNLMLRCLRDILPALSLSLAGCAPGARNEQTSPPQGPERPIRISGSGTAMPLVQKLADAYNKEHADARFQFEPGTNTGGAVRGVTEKTLDIAVANRPLNASERKKPLEYHPFARDAIVFAVKLPNPVKGLSTAQVRDIYGGSVTNWKELGGYDKTIIVLDRDEDESARKLVFLPLMDGRPVKAKTVILTKARDMAQALESTPNCVGYSSLGLLHILQPRDVRVLSLDGVAPGAKSQTAGRYPWQLTFALIRRRDAPEAVRRFVDFSLGQKGRQVLEEYDYAACKR